MIWLNPSALRSEKGSHDGLYVLAQESTACLKRKGLDIHRNVHPDFVSAVDTRIESSAADLSINLSALCPITDFDHIQRRSNRFVVVGSGRSIYFQTVAAHTVDTATKKNFEAITMLAFVVVLRED